MARWGRDGFGWRYANKVFEPTGEYLKAVDTSMDWLYKLRAVIGVALLVAIGIAYHQPVKRVAANSDPVLGGVGDVTGPLILGLLLVVPATVVVVWYTKRGKRAEAFRQMLRYPVKTTFIGLGILGLLWGLEQILRVLNDPGNSVEGFIALGISLVFLRFFLFFPRGIYLALVGLFRMGDGHPLLPPVVGSIISWAVAINGLASGPAGTGEPSPVWTAAFIIAPATVTLLGYVEIMRLRKWYRAEFPFRDGPLPALKFDQPMAAGSGQSRAGKTEAVYHGDQGSSVTSRERKIAGNGVRWLVVVAGALAAFFGCLGGLAAARVADTGTDVGIAAAPFAVALAILATWAARSRVRASDPDDAPALETAVDRAARHTGRGEAGNGSVRDRGDGEHSGSNDAGRHYEGGPQPRFLTGTLPERVVVDARISLEVQITLEAADRASTALESFQVSPPGSTVTITVSAPTLSPLGDLEQDLSVPPNADSRPVRFGFIARPTGLHVVRVRAFIGGTCLGELTLQISVQPEAALEEGRPRTAPLAGLTAEPGEVTLQVSRTAGGGYSFQLLSEALYPMVLIDRLARDPAAVVEQIVAELRTMAQGRSQYSTSALARKRLRSLGVRLWADVVPVTIREQFWAQRDRIRNFTIASDLDTVPWELLYPVDLENEDGFLVEQFPVVRRVYGQGRARILRVDKGVGFIVPPRSPASAIAEVTAVRSVLPRGMVYRGTEAGLAEVLELLDAVPSVLHFAGHNAFTDEIGSLISLDGGPLRPDDLYPSKQKRAFENVSPLVFFNGCRTAGEIPGFTQMNGWAQEFMGAGAAAFIGSLWAVRSSSAAMFAEEFYRALIRDRQPLGVASQHARQLIAADESDPTWLAYTVYGNPSATVEDSSHRHV
jgi:CHAT domain